GINSCKRFKICAYYTMFYHLMKALFQLTSERFGFLCASMCTATSALHGGFVLYNGGFTSGITVLILLPILEKYVPNTRDEIKDQRLNMQELISLVGNHPAPGAGSKKGKEEHKNS
ncbi:MAG: DUF1576 domain-containing protein, partial [Lachnospiraceae bacterium]|nr:DUF1576 domain-containing protein [Lachnospiraceae bacterium]